jgi:hypothetical protein
VIEWQVEAAVAAASFDQLDTNKDGVITREENLRSAATDECRGGRLY